MLHQQHETKKYFWESSVFKLANIDTVLVGNAILGL